MNFYQVINNFLYHYENNNGGLKLDADNMFRKNIAKELKIWLMNNLYHFNKY